MPPADNRLQRDLTARLLELLRRDGAIPGTRLTELGLARRLQVSRTPVRTLLEQLARRGIAERRPGGGFLLRDLPAATVVPDAGGDAIDQLCIRVAADRVAGRLPGEVSEADLMRRYAISRGILLRVLGRLAEIAMVERRPGHGWSFLPIIRDGQARAESFAFRRILEPAALQAPGHALPPGWAAAMRRRHEELLARPWKPADSVALFEMNAEFHEGLVAGAGNRYLLLAVQQQSRLRRFLNYDWNYGYERVVTSCTEHLEILARVERGEMEIAALLLRRHLDRAGQLPRLA